MLLVKLKYSYKKQARILVYLKIFNDANFHNFGNLIIDISQIYFRTRRR